PNAPLPLPIPRAALRDVKPAWRALAIAQVSETATPCVARHFQRAELAPMAQEENFDVFFSAGDKGDLEIIEQVKKQNIGKATIRRDDQFASRHVTQNDLEEALDKGALDFAAMPFECAFVIRAPVDGHGAASNDGRCDQRVDAVLDRPINRDSNKGVPCDVRDELGGDAFRQVFGAQSRVMQKARNPSDSSFLVFKGRGDLGLRAGPGFQQGINKGDEGFDLMTMSPRIELRDKFGQASGTRVWV